MDFIDLFLTWARSLGDISYLIVFMAAVLDAFILVGAIIPGSLMIILAGVLAAHGILNIYLLFWIVTIGGIIGDILGYYLGANYGKGALDWLGRYFKWDYLKMGEDFFKKYGERSIFVGRFMAVVRPLVPFFAGLFAMDMKRFLLLNIAGAILAALFYLSVGYFFGATIRTAVAWSSRIGLVILGAAVLILASRVVKLELLGKKAPLK